MRGRLINIEGTDCSGKNTQTSLLVQRLKREGRKVEALSFPMYETPTGRIVGGCYLGNPHIGEGYFDETAVEVDPKVASLYYAADRKYNIAIVNDLLSQGYDVILDRYVESNMGHQAAKIKNKEDRYKMYEWLEKLEYELLELPKADITILLYMSLEKILELKSLRNVKKDQMDDSIDNIKNANIAYLELAELHDYKTINCLKDDKIRSIEDIHAEIYEIVNGLVE